MNNRCPNCKGAITCSCQIRTASDGTKVCSKCITSYEINAKNNGAIITSSYITPDLPK